MNGDADLANRPLRRWQRSGTWGDALRTLTQEKVAAARSRPGNYAEDAGTAVQAGRAMARVADRALFDGLDFLAGDALVGRHEVGPGRVHLVGDADVASGVEYWRIRQQSDKRGTDRAPNIRLARADEGLVARLATVGPGIESDHVFFPARGRLVAHWLPTNPPENSSMVADPGTGAANEREAGLDTIFRVREWVAPGAGHSAAGPKTYSIAIPAANDPRGSGYARFTFNNIDALGSYIMSGPFVPATSKHKHADTGDGPIHSLALSTLSNFRGSGIPFDAPLDFKEEPYPHPLRGPTPWEVDLLYDANKNHKFFPGGTDVAGMWRWVCWGPFGETPPCESTKQYDALDANGNPQRSYAEQPRLMSQRKLLSSGMYFQPRVNYQQGRIRRAA